MNSIPLVAGLSLPCLPEAHRLNRILDTALKERLCGWENANNYAFPYWNAEFFNLHQVTLFEAANDLEKAAIVQLANQSMLEEAYYIEKAGMGYMAKMMFLADSTEERMLYGLFTADETLHFSQIRQLLATPPLTTETTFLHLLSDLVESQDKAVLLFVIQVVLEGWGLSHYRRLAQACHDRDLQALFQSFLQAEARHHATGITLTRQSQISAASQKIITEVLADFLQMVQVGPQTVLAAIAQVKGHLSRTQKVKILQELDTESHSSTRLKLLKSFIRGESVRAIAGELEQRGLFTPYSAEQCLFS